MKRLALLLLLFAVACASDQQVLVTNPMTTIGSGVKLRWVKDEKPCGQPDAKGEIHDLCIDRKPAQQDGRK